MQLEENILCRSEQKFNNLSRLRYTQRKRFIIMEALLTYNSLMVDHFR